VPANADQELLAKQLKLEMPAQPRPRITTAGRPPKVFTIIQAHDYRIFCASWESRANATGQVLFAALIEALYGIDPTSCVAKQ
jgi:hypothetical protein